MNITEGDADEFRLHLAETMGGNTVHRTCGRAKQFFRAAVRKRLIDQSPFGDMRDTGVKANRREYFLSRADADKVLEACPDADWRLIFVLSRYGGLRCPSEHLALTWADVDWERNRLRVPSPKTEHHEGRDHRWIPLFPEIRRELRRASGTLCPTRRRHRADRHPLPFGCEEPAHDVVKIIRRLSWNRGGSCSRICGRPGRPNWPRRSRSTWYARGWETRRPWRQSTTCKSPRNTSTGRRNWHPKKRATAQSAAVSVRKSKETKSGAPENCRVIPTLTNTYDVLNSPTRTRT